MAYTARQGQNSEGLHQFTGFGMMLNFQDGPIGEVGVNGTTTEEVIQVLIDRLTSFQQMQQGKFACKENTCAITHLQEALHWLESRTRARVKRGVEGTLAP